MINFKQALCLALLMLLPLAVFANRASQRYQRKYRLRVMTYNIRHSRGLDECHDLRRIARLIRRYRVDVVALQEVDVETRRVGGLDQVKRLSHLSGMKAVFGQTISFQGGKFGNAVLSRLPIVRHTNPQITGSEGAEERNVLQVTVRLTKQQLYRPRKKANKGPHPSLSIWATHLDYGSKKIRLVSAQKINKWVQTLSMPVVLMGDLNATPRSAPIQELQKLWRNTTQKRPLRTIPTRYPKRQIDYVMLRQASSWSIRRVHVLRHRIARIASDHRPLLADLVLRVPKNP